MAPAPSVVFFDLDGTLVDTAWFHTLAWWRAFMDHGHQVPMATIQPLIGMGGPQLLDAVLGDNQPAIADAHDGYFKEYRDQAVPLPGARDLLRTLRRRSFNLLLVTSSKPEDADALLDIVGVSDLFDDIVHSEEVEQTKPEPDLFHVALQRAGVVADQALAVGDAEWDVQAAGRAGIASVGVETGGTSAGVLRRAGAVEVYPDCQGILDGWSTGPFADAG